MAIEQLAHEAGLSVPNAKPVFDEEWARKHAEQLARKRAELEQAGAEAIERMLSSEKVVPTTTIVVATASHSAPPIGFAFLLSCLAKPGRADEVIGDAEEEYRKMVARLGPVWARWHYRVCVLRVSISMLPSMMARVVLLHKLLGLLGL